ncbi:MAG: PIG-L family deacetylase [Puniceicoccales bacterium]|jgi:LmbE family N-acetylglucosaminyl deacetylase|nr:PIG-L family deacetylase [Puniceicoccales bacterium]
MKIRKFLIKLIPFQDLRHKLHDMYFPHKIEIIAKTKCLFVAPHPDDEMIGGGGVMCLYPKNFDVVVMGSSGNAWQSLTAEQRATIRTDEFGDVVNMLEIKDDWIVQTMGLNGITQMNELSREYLKALRTAQYDYIFVPVPHGRHPDHNHIVNKLFKRILRHSGYRKNLRIVFYEVWSLLPNPNCFIDTTKVIDRKTKILRLYKSAHVRSQYADTSRALNQYRGRQNNTLGFAEEFFFDSVHNYLHHHYKVPIDGSQLLP